jgi:hypothetical protein
MQKTTPQLCIDTQQSVDKKPLSDCLGMNRNESSRLIWGLKIRKVLPRPQGDEHTDEPTSKPVQNAIQIVETHASWWQDMKKGGSGTTNHDLTRINNYQIAALSNDIRRAHKPKRAGQM